MPSTNFVTASSSAAGSLAAARAVLLVERRDRGRLAGARRARARRPAGRRGVRRGAARVPASVREGRRQPLRRLPRRAAGRSADARGVRRDSARRDVPHELHARAAGARLAAASPAAICGVRASAAWGRPICGWRPRWRAPSGPPHDASSTSSCYRPSPGVPSAPRGESARLDADLARAPRFTHAAVLTAVT